MQTKRCIQSEGSRPETRLTPSQKGAIAEMEIAAAAVRLELPVLRPVIEGGRYDLAFDLGHKILRVQCKWATCNDEVLTIRCATSRRTLQGYLKTTYSADEVDAIAAYSPQLDQSYLIPIAEVERMAAVTLRLTPTRNNQALNVRWACDFELSTSLSRHWALGEHRTQIWTPALRAIE